jgi:hypothetical protein
MEAKGVVVSHCPSRESDRGREIVGQTSGVRCDWLIANKGKYLLTGDKRPECIHSSGQVPHHFVHAVCR